jgi:prevent-host-death family protein
MTSYISDYGRNCVVQYEMERRMAIIRPVSDLQRKIGELSTIAVEQQEPIYLTRRGKKFLVLVDADKYDRLEKKAREKEGADV